jgi:RimJ/RimL family protein N-acetyltransferase
VIDTARLILRGWYEGDRGPLHAIASDPKVMRYLGPIPSRAESDAGIDRQNALIASCGHGFWAVERRVDGVLLGFCGIKPGPAGTPLANGMEIGWRLAHAHWGHGYAREAAQVSLDWAWAHLGVAEIAAMTVRANTASWGLMERLGMVRDVASDFDHPGVPDASPLRAHIVYRISRPAAAPGSPRSG